MFISRKSGAPARLVWRVRLLGLGALLALTGIGTGAEWVVNLAIGVLVLGFGLRFLPADSGVEAEGQREAGSESISELDRDANSGAGGEGDRADSTH